MLSSSRWLSGSSDSTDVGNAGAPASSSRVKIESLDSGIAKVTLNRPDKLNGLDMDMFEAIAGAAARMRDDRSVRAVILCGEGKAFCTGLDVKSVVGSSPLKNTQRLLESPSGYSQSTKNIENSAKLAMPVSNLAQDVAYLWRDVHVPVIAVLHGMCFGGGLQIALGADFRFCTPDCRLSIMEAKYGIIPDMSASVTLRELVRIDIAKELAMTGKIINGDEAARLGLVTRCMEDPMDEALKLAKEIVEKSPDAVSSVKRLFQDTWVASEAHCLMMEAELQKPLLASWNQMAASGRSFGANLPYKKRAEMEPNREED